MKAKFDQEKTEMLAKQNKLRHELVELSNKLTKEREFHKKQLENNVPSIILMFDRASNC